MTADHAIIAGSFSDFKLIKTRSTAQLIIEIPIEQADEALERLGGVPQSGKEKPVAVARLNLAADVRNHRTTEMPSQPSEKPASGGNGSGEASVKGGRRARQAGIVCGEGAFKTYLEEKWTNYIVTSPSGGVDTRLTVHAICGVNSRARLDHDDVAARAWDDVHGGYIVWRDNS